MMMRFTLKTNNFWLRIFDNKSIEFLLDVSTGEFLASQGMQNIDKLLQNFSPSEVLIKKTIKIFQGKFW
jgi:DNA mismatch repair protein MutS